MKTPINPLVVKQLLIDFPNRFSSRFFAKALRDKGYNYETSGGQLATHLRNLGCYNDIYCSKMWNKKVNNSSPTIQSKDIKSFSDEELIAEIKRRGYTGTLNPPTKSINL